MPNTTVGYEIAVSDDGSAWTVAYKTTEGRGGREEVDRLESKGRYVRINLLQRGTEHGFSIYEFHVMRSSAK